MHLGERDAIDQRLAELAEAEGEIVAKPCEWVRIHAG